MDYQSHNGHVMTLANSIIGVSVLAMPFCFKQCGIILSILMLFISSIISRLACHFLVKSAIITRRKTFEFLAFHIFGSLGKFAIEVGIIGFLIGTCVAFFVVMGDLGPEIISEITGTGTSLTMRTSILMALALFCVLPMGLLRNVDSLNGVSKATIGFYCCLVLKIVFEAIPHLFNGDWFKSVIFWRPAGLLQCLPIFSMALFCQTQLFEIYQILPNATLEKMNELVRIAVNICTCVYIFVGTFGYIAFSHQAFTGNILLTFSPSIITDILKLGFVLSVAFSFPLVIFPCRASLYSLLFKENHYNQVHESNTNYIPEGKFKGLTLLIVFVSLITGILIPNIELVLGLVGSTIGVMICVLFPVTCFICINPKNTNERILAQVMLCVGVLVMVLGTYKNLYTLETTPFQVQTTEKVLKNRIFEHVDELVPKKSLEVSPLIKVAEIKVDKVKIEPIAKVDVKEIRHEPPQPEEPAETPPSKKIVKPIIPPLWQSSSKAPENLKLHEIKLETIITSQNPQEKYKQNDEVDIEAIRKEDTELKNEETEKNKNENQILIDTIKKQQDFQKQLAEQQQKILEVIQQHKEDTDKKNINEEKLKAVQHIESMAVKAIQQISANGNDDKKIVEVGKPRETLNDKNKEFQATDKVVAVQIKLNEKQKNISKNLTKQDSRSFIPLPIVVSQGKNSVIQTNLLEKTEAKVETVVTNKTKNKETKNNDDMEKEMRQEIL